MTVKLYYNTCKCILKGKNGNTYNERKMIL